MWASLKKKKATYLKGREMRGEGYSDEEWDREGESELSTFHLLAHSPTAMVGQARQKPGAGNSILAPTWVPGTQVRGLSSTQAAS